MIANHMMDEQFALEAEMREVTRARYYRMHEKAEEREEFADTHAGRNVFDHAFDTFLKGIEGWVAEKKEGKAGRRPRAIKLIDDFNDTPTLAYIFLRHLINTTLTMSKSGKGKPARKTRVVLMATQAIHDELRMRYFAENRKALLKKIVKDFQQRELPRRRRRELMIRQFHTQQLEWQAEGWGQAERLNLGLVLLEIFQRTTGMIEEYTVTEGVRTIDCVAFTAEMHTALAERMDKAANLFTVFYPLVVKPRPWSNSALIGGAYYTENVEPYRFVKGAKVKYLREMENRDMTSILRAINAMQDTGWRVNPIMLDTMNHVYSHNIEVKGLPSADPMPIPPAPPGVDDSADLLAAYRKDCYIVHDTNRRMISKRISVLRTISLAQRFADYEAIYFPYDVDSRGRAYPKVPFLNPQGTDYVKSLLEFSVGKPIETEEHAAYLAIAIANAWGQDKLPLQDRVDWVCENEEMLLEVARNPKGDLRWTKASEPFMALRGAIEWLGLAEYGPGYVSHMPVHFDATCSGLQHFSALLRDAEGGFHVNLTGCEERQDIYAAVATKALVTLEADTSDEARIALQMGISRDLCKRPVMIVPYSGTFSACMEYVRDHYQERVREGEKLPLDMNEISSRIVPLVAKHVWDAIGRTVIAAREAMDWITHAARIASKEADAPIQWTTPDGFVVQQAKYEETEQRVNTFLDGGRRVRSHLITRTSKLDPRKMAQSLSPNYIHSLDACHMRGAINKALDLDLDMSFAMIHDSFGVHACDMPVFAEKCIKPAFVEMYEGRDNLALFRTELMLNVKEEDAVKVRALPASGSLDVREVLDSQFFFS